MTCKHAVVGLTSSMEEAGVGLCGPVMGFGLQTGVAARGGELGWGQAEAEGRFGVTGEDGWIECWGPGWCGEWWWQVVARGTEPAKDLCRWADEKSEEAGVGAEVWEAGEIVCAGVLILGWFFLTAVGGAVGSFTSLWALTSWFCCSSETFCADSWSCTYITWAPTPSLTVRGERPVRKSLICQRGNTLMVWNRIFKLTVILTLF